MTPSVRGKALRGNFIHAPEPGAIEPLVDGLLTIDDTGTISGLYPAEHPDRAATEKSARDTDDFIEFAATDYLIPGFVDLHVHAPQYPKLGLALEEPLEVWLEKYTFPLDARSAELNFAPESKSQLVGELRRNVPTTAKYVTAVHHDAVRHAGDTSLAAPEKMHLPSE